ncbi:vitamin B12 dependent-methionine synthase activation domain-containing protein [Agathobaculum sp. Marseille-P7918]|uniref:vitamin B12 dependent-methionine synthase activation domain-containing protein n=1 Tax=Agathobaculum sp. Marseille-P7918 TaxID=2479843 RepID=UPI000F63E2D2|nr:vitamin B12 dependent-methionine synthase activation domain-containing protein [Agathobaculum sp. Marseille-P7918]
MIAFERSEALRYLGYHGTQQPDEAVQQSLDRCADELQNVVAPKSVFQAFPLTHPVEGTMKLADVFIHSKNLSRTLKGCTSVYLMAATLGIDVDRLIARASAVRMSDAVMYQAIAAAMIEAYCDEVNEVLRQEAERVGLYCRPRFSPGYGDFRIEHQRDFSRLLNTPKKIGLTVTESCLLVPIKSVTAVIGLSNSPQPCHRKGCEECDKKDCAFRR